MKNLLLLALVGIFTSCTKDDSGIVTNNKVEYIIYCKQCSVTMDVASGSKTIDVTGYLLRAEINTLPVINVVTDGEGDITVKLKVDEKEVYNVTNAQKAGTPVKHTIKR